MSWGAKLAVRLSTIAAIALAGAVLVYALYAATATPGNFTGPVPSNFTVNGRTFHFTYVATTEHEREVGLMNKTVTNSTTMLFAFPYSYQWEFWMFDTNTSLDMIWVSATADSGKVVYVVPSAPPCFVSSQCAKYAPSASANFVIEAKGGFAAAYGIVVGTPITFG